MLLVPGGLFLEEALAPLAERRQVIFYDMRGRGRSEPVTDPGSLGLEREVEDLERTRRWSGAERVSLLGFSYLGAVVALYAAAHPARVERLIQISPLAPRRRAPYALSPPELAPEGAAELRRLESAGTPRSDPSRYCEAWWRHHLPAYAAGEPTAEILDMLRTSCRYTNEQPDRFLATLAAVFAEHRDWDFREEARRVQARTLVIHGREDRVAPLEGAREWVRLLPEARLLEIGATGHLVALERTAAVLAALEVFLSGDWPGEAAPV